MQEGNKVDTIQDKRYMRSQRQEAERPCEQCRFYQRSGKRELTLFNDGKNYMTTGSCTNPDSPLNTRKLTGSFTASVNAMHHRLTNFLRMVCFVPAQEGGASERLPLR